MSEWQDISTAPRDEIILITDGSSVVAGCWAPMIHGERYPWAFVDDYSGADLNNGGVGVPANAYEERFITHWMPLPKAPNAA